jgi:hypothetical protein
MASKKRKSTKRGRAKVQNELEWAIAEYRRHIELVEDAAKLVQFLRRNGFTLEEAHSVQDWRAIRIIREAMNYRTHKTRKRRR